MIWWPLKRPVFCHFLPHATGWLPLHSTIVTCQRQMQAVPPEASHAGHILWIWPTSRQFACHHAPLCLLLWHHCFSLFAHAAPDLNHSGHNHLMSTDWTGYLLATAAFPQLLCTCVTHCMLHPSHFMQDNHFFMETF